MNYVEFLAVLPLFSLVLGAGACLAVRSPVWLLRVPAISAIALVCATVPPALRLFSAGSYTMLGGNLLLDPLSFFHILLVIAVFLITSFYATGYFGHELASGHLSVRSLRRFALLWLAFQTMLILVLLSNNVGLMWVAIEATTIVSAFLILSDAEPLSIEAMWKYLLVCSVGIVFAFMGTTLTIAAAQKFHDGSPYLFTELIKHPELIDPKLILFAFILITIGFGTKAGLAPMHTWLPDAHSQAPTPVSAVFSGVMLNCALYCIIRYLPVVEAATGHDGQAHSLLLLFGFVSLVIAAVFIPGQADLKRFLAYCSVEHIGIITIGLGLGGTGTFAALLHTMNHSLSKTLSFFAAGKIGAAYGTRDMRQITGSVSLMPWWGTALFVSILTLIGVAPFCIFMSEFLILKQAFFTGRYLLFGLFMGAVLTVFISALRHFLGMSFGSSKKSSKEVSAGTTGTLDKITIAVVALVLLLLGVWIPSPVSSFLKDCATIVENGVRL